MKRRLLQLRRDDLPEMRWPLVVVTIAAVCLCGGGALILWNSVPVLTVPFLVLAAVFYSLLILLWRRLAALALPLGIGGFILASGGGWFPAVCCGLGLLAVAYTYASLFLARESRFVRIASTASAIGICTLLITAAWISWRFGTFGDALNAVLEFSRAAADDGLQRLYAAEGETTMVLLPETVNSLLYQGMLAVPALAGMGCILLAGICDGAIRFFFWLLDCGAYFAAEADSGITMPRSFGVLYAVLLFLVMGTSSAASPQLYSVLSNCHWIFALPCAWVGLSVGYRKIRHSLAEASFYGSVRTHSPIPTVLILVFIGLTLGLSASFTLAAAVGAVCVITCRRNQDTEDMT